MQETDRIYLEALRRMLSQYMKLYVLDAERIRNAKALCAEAHKRMEPIQ